MAGEWLTATSNTNMFTYEIAPVFILMEHECLRKMREIIGFQNGDSILAPGGSINNMYALMIARHKMYPQHKAHGMRAIKGQLIMYTSKHVSIQYPFHSLTFSNENEMVKEFRVVVLANRVGILKAFFFHQRARLLLVLRRQHSRFFFFPVAKCGRFKTWNLFLIP